LDALTLRQLGAGDNRARLFRTAPALGAFFKM
jgi:hypothetical protein